MHTSVLNFLATHVLYMYMYTCTCIMIVFLVLCILSCSSVHQYNEEVLMIITHLNVLDLYINFKCKKTQWNIHYSHVAVHILGHTADIYQH